MARSRVEYDDDDFDGYMRPQSQGAGNGRFIATVVGAVIVVALVAGMLVLFVSRGRRAEIAVDRAHAEAARAEAARGANNTRPSTPTTVWPRMIGTWTRTPAEKERGGYPYYLDFRSNRTATIKHPGSDNMPIQHEVTVEIISEQNNTARIRLLMKEGLYGYTFTVKPDGTLSLDNVDGGLIFHRDK